MSNVDETAKSVDPGDLLLKLPSALVLDFLMSWVEVKQICVLDSAYCSRFSRGTFLELVAKAVLCVPSQPVKVNILQFSRWLLNKRTHIVCACEWGITAGKVALVGEEFAQLLQIISPIILNRDA